MTTVDSNNSNDDSCCPLFVCFECSGQDCGREAYTSTIRIVRSNLTQPALTSCGTRRHVVCSCGTIRIVRSDPTQPALTSCTTRRHVVCSCGTIRIVRSDPTQPALTSCTTRRHVVCSCGSAYLLSFLRIAYYLQLLNSILGTIRRMILSWL